MNLYIKCPNIEASMYAQVKLRDVFGFQILKENNEPHFTDRFVVVTPPEYCTYAEQLNKPETYGYFREHTKICTKCGQFKDDKPVICSYQTSMDRDGTLAPPDSHNWIEMLDAIKLISMVTPKITPVHNSSQIKNKDKIKLYTQSSVKSGLKHCSVYVARAVKKGKLINLKTSFIYCDFCKKARAVQYEHRDYNKPLEVKPVCVSCNRKLKSAIKRKKLTNK